MLPVNRPSGIGRFGNQAARKAYERGHILKELDRTHGNISRAAEALGLERSHL